MRSAVEFGDKLVREVMTPRPRVFAVPESITLEEFLEQLRDHNFSRVPVYSGSLDNITGIAFAHDLLQITDEEARTRTVAASSARLLSCLKPSAATSCCARCSAKSSTCASSSTSTAASPAWSPSKICWNRSSATSATNTKLIRPSKIRSARPAAHGWCPAAFPSISSPTSSASQSRSRTSYEATTLGGLVSEIEGRIPLPGEVVMLDHAGVRIEVVASTDRRVERLRVFPPRIETAAAQAS